MVVTVSSAASASSVAHPLLPKQGWAGSQAGHYYGMMIVSSDGSVQEVWIECMRILIAVQDLIKDQRWPK